MLIAVAGAVVLVLVAAGALLVPRVLGRTGDADEAVVASTEPPHPDVWDERVAPIAEWVADERDLEFEHPVTVRFLSEEDYQAEAEGGEDSDEADDELEHYAGIWRAMGLVEGDLDLGTAGETLMGEGTLAYYTPAEQVVYVRGTELTPAVRVTIAHELTHVLQDQHFDLERLDDPDFDRGAGLRALAEGDAQRIEDAFVDERLTAEEQAAYEEESASSGEEAEEALAEDVPPALQAFFSAPYVLGSGLVDRLTRIDGPGAIDDLLEDPPSEEELLDPSIRGTVRAEVAEPEVEAPEGAEDVEDGVVGPLAWYLMLAARGEPIDALRAVDGWGGDAMVSYRDGGSSCFRGVVAGDDAPAAATLEDALREWAAAGPAGAASVEVTADGHVRLEACDPGGDATSNGDVSVDLIALPAIRSELATQLEETGWPADAARCAGDRVAGLYPVSVLTSPDPPTTEQSLEIQEAILSCR